MHCGPPNLNLRLTPMTEVIQVQCECIVVNSRWVGHPAMTRMNSGNECCSAPPYQCNNRTMTTSSSNGRNPRYSSYVESNGFDADDSATLRPGVQVFVCVNSNISSCIWSCLFRFCIFPPSDIFGKR